MAPAGSPPNHSATAPLTGFLSAIRVADFRVFGLVNRRLMRVD
jgi:hypothetical protein